LSSTGSDNINNDIGAKDEQQRQQLSQQHQLQQLDSLSM
jgi:hypothetical protein